MTLCGANRSCGCVVRQAFAGSTGSINGQLPSILVTGGGGYDDPWEASLNPNWIAGVTNLINASETWIPSVPWIMVPAFQNGWANYRDVVGANFPRVAYRKVGDIVYLQGLMSRAAGLGPGPPVVAFNLPVGYRPLMAEIFAADKSSLAHGRIDVTANGNVQVTWTGSPDGYFSVSGVSFSTTA